MPIGHLRTQAQAHVENRARDLRRRVHQRLHVVALEVDIECRVVQLGEIGSQLLGGRRRPRRDLLDGRKVILQPPGGVVCSIRPSPLVFAPP